jgi:hypothetical protein
MFKNFKLGKAPAKLDPRTVRLSSVIGVFPPAPVQFDYSSRIKNLEMLGNDTLGDCTAAGAGHLHQAWTAYNGNEFNPTTEETIAFYSGSTGYSPNDPNSDKGGVMLDVLNYWKKNGFAGHTIDAYLSVDPKNQAEIKTALYHFGGLYKGLALPLSVQNATVWKAPVLGMHGKSAPGSWGGHCVADVLTYNVRQQESITWGTTVESDWEFTADYCDELYVVLSPDWYGAEKVCPTGFNVTELLSLINSQLKQSE